MFKCESGPASAGQLMYRHISQTYQRELKESAPELKHRIIAWRRGPRVVRVQRPTRLDRARSIGYKAKQGVVVARVRLSRGGMRMKRPVAGRRPKHLGTVKIKGNLSEADVARQRARRRFPNMHILGSYPLARDGRFSWFEVVMVDTSHPAIQSDREFRSRLG
jgi:large subunit ribosomal protein L15e